MRDTLAGHAKDPLTLALAGLGITFAPYEWIDGLFLALAQGAVHHSDGQCCHSIAAACICADRRPSVGCGRADRDGWGGGGGVRGCAIIGSKSPRKSNPAGLQSGVQGGMYDP